MSGRLDKAQLETLVASGEIDTVVAAFTDMQGRLIGKRVTAASSSRRCTRNGTPATICSTVDMEMEPVPGFKAASWEKGYGDFVVRPDLGTLRRIPWLPGTALVLGDVADHHGHELPHQPARDAQAPARAAQGSCGYTAKMASELEFYVFDDSYAARRARRATAISRPPAGTSRTTTSSETTKREPLMRAIRNGMEAAGIPVQESKGEWGPGQEELNLVYAEALEMADRHVIYKNGVKEIAWLQGKAVSFMAKWRADLAGNSCHIHGSLWDDGRPAGVQRQGHGETRAVPPVPGRPARHARAS